MEEIQTLLNTPNPAPWLVEISDGRLIRGRCVCVDPALNLVLEAATEEFPPSKNADSDNNKPGACASFFV